jgi:hypothetical protein
MKISARTEPFQRFITLCIATTLVFCGCAETAKIVTEPEGANVYVDGVLVGETPVVYQYRSGLPETYYLRVKRDGYLEVKNVVLKTQYRADASLFLLVLGIVPYFFSARLEDQTKYVLEPE